jgi:DNA invertase Pin-like site-specific DNA recombinase
LGLEAQQTAVAQYAKQIGAETSAEYREIETGKRANRPELAKAIAHAKREGATLVVAKLDRLARNVAFTAALMDSGVDFIACDNPNANRLTIHILAAVAEDEARRISQRTKDALAAYKRRGGVLGSDRPGHWEGRERGYGAATKAAAAARLETARRSIGFLVPTMKALRTEGKSYQAVADHLNALGHATQSGKAWTATGVMRAVDRVLV